MRITETLDGRQATQATVRTYRLTERAGLRPRIEPYRGTTYRVILNGEGTGALFGCITVSGTTGRVLHAHLTQGNAAPEEFVVGAQAVHAFLRRYRDQPNQRAS